MFSGSNCCFSGKTIQEQAQQTFTYLCPVIFILSIILVILTGFSVTSIYNGSVPWVKEVIILIEYVTVDIKKISGTNAGCSKLPLPYTDYELYWEPIANYVLKSHINSCRCASENEREGGFCFEWCKPISRISAELTLSTWGTEESPYSLCQLVYQQRFIDGILKYNGECPQIGYYQCNMDGPLQFQFCSPFQQLCPIYDLISIKQQTNITDEGPYFNYIGTPEAATYTQIEKDSKFFISKESQITHSISDFRILDLQDIQEYQQNRTEMSIINVIGKKKFIQMNVPSEWGVQEEEFANTENLSLISRPYLPIKMECRQNQFLNILSEEVKFGFQTIAALSLGSVLLIFSISFLVIGFCGLLCQWQKNENTNPYQEQCNTGCGLYCRCCLCCKRRWKKKVIYDSCGDYCRLIDPCVLILSIIHFLFLFLSLIILIFGSSMAIRSGNFYQSLDQRKCFNETTNQIISNGFKEFQRAKLGCIFVIILIVLLTIFVGIVYCSIWRQIVQQRRLAFQRIKELNLPENSYQTIDEKCLELGKDELEIIQLQMNGNKQAYNQAAIDSPK